LIVAVLENKVESDILNSLAALGEVNFLKIDFLRAVRNYLEQLDATTSRVKLLIVCL